MIFKRKESFRFEFGEPVPVNFVILLNGKPFDVERTQNPATILDISPCGMKMFSNTEIGEYSNKLVQLEVNFILDETVIRAISDIVWEKPYGNGYQYGLIFNNQKVVESLIVSELKIRRKKEVQRAKGIKRPIS